MPDSCEGVVAAFANGPDHDRHGFAAAFDIQGRIVEARTRNKEQRTEVRIGLGLDANRLTEGAGAKHGEVRVASRGAGVPEVFHVIASVECVVVL